MWDTNERGDRMKKWKHLLLRTGKYVKGGVIHDFTLQRLQNLLNNFKIMKSNGVDVDVVVDHSREAEAVLGYVTDMELTAKGELYGIHELKDTEDLPERCKNVSVHVVPDYVDGNGNRYHECIIHSSYVQQPVVAGQPRPLPLAAALWFSLGDEVMPETAADQGTPVEMTPDRALGELIVLLELGESVGWAEVIGAVKKAIGKEP